ncbi:MAG: MFS transporter [Holosporales bacterium]|jgi:DHA1 family bicyclomycin/chloramphenicol resistance-like MFS transporter|nr:MFS transporter [Holosporales bacterium]
MLKSPLPVLLFANVISTSVVNLCIPALPLLAKDLCISAFIAQGTISIHMFGSFLGRIFWGPLSDIYGRRFLLVRGLAISILGLAGCCLATNIYYLLFFRAIQAIGSGVVLIISMVIVSDISTGAKRARNLGFIEASWPISWIFAPIIGSFLCSISGWRANFLFLFAMQFFSLLMVYLYIPETLDQSSRSKSFSMGFSGYRLLLTNPSFMIYASMPGLILSGYMLFAVSAPFLYTIDFKFTIQEFAFIQALPLLVSFCMTLSYRSIIKKLGEKTGLYLGIGFYTTFALLNILMLLGIFTITPYRLLFAICIQCLSSACLIPACCSLALNNAPKGASGTAASVISVLRNLIASICLIFGSMIYTNGNPKQMILSISLTIMLAFGLSIPLVKKFKNAGSNALPEK